MTADDCVNRHLRVGPSRHIGRGRPSGLPLRRTETVAPRTYVRLVPRVSGSTSVEGVLVDWVVRHPVTPSQLPVEWLSREQKAAELARLQAEKAARAAYEAELI